MACIGTRGIEDGLPAGHQARLGDGEELPFGGVCPDGKCVCGTDDFIDLVWRRCASDQIGSVVRSQHSRVGAALGSQAVQFVDQVLACDAAPRALTGYVRR
jgi:hypothetical protein